MASCSCGTRDKLNPCPGARRANIAELITDMKWALAYRLLAWHGTMLSDFNLYISGVNSWQNLVRSVRLVVL